MIVEQTQMKQETISHNRVGKSEQKNDRETHGESKNEAKTRKNGKLPRKITPGNRTHKLPVRTFTSRCINKYKLNNSLRAKLF